MKRWTQDEIEWAIVAFAASGAVIVWLSQLANGGAQ